jgi:hypothetical protein
MVTNAFLLSSKMTPTVPRRAEPIQRRGNERGILFINLVSFCSVAPLVDVNTGIEIVNGEEIIFYWAD